MKNAKGNMSLKQPSKSPDKIQLVKLNQNVRHSYFSVLRNLTKDKSSLLMPSAEKKPPKYLEDLYTKYSANLEVYLMNNKSDIKLYGSRRYENESIDSILNDIKSNKGKVIEKLRCKPLPCSITEYDDDKIILTPLPNKSRQTLESSKDKEEFFNAERQAVVMRTVEYTHAVRNKQNNEESIKAMRDFEQHSNDKSNRLMMLKLFKKPVNVIEMWWFGLKKKRKNFNNDQIKRHKTTPQEENTFNFIDNYNDSTADYGFDLQTKINNNIYEHKERLLAAKVLFNRIQSQEKHLFHNLITALNAENIIQIHSTNVSNEKELTQISKAKLLAGRFIMYKLRDIEITFFRKLIAFKRHKEILTTKMNKQLMITKECYFGIKVIRKKFSINHLEEESEYCFELLSERETSLKEISTHANQYRFSLIKIEYEISFKIEGEEFPFARHCIKDNYSSKDYQNKYFDTNSFAIEYIESIQFNLDTDYEDVKLQNNICINEWALITKVIYQNKEKNIKLIQLIQNYCLIKRQNQKKDKMNLLTDSEDNYEAQDQDNSHQLIHLNKKENKIRNKNINDDDFIHHVQFDFKSFFISKERKYVTIAIQQIKSRNVNNHDTIKPMKSEDIQIYSQTKQNKDNCIQGNKSFDRELENSLRDKLLKHLVANKDKKINKEMKELELSYHQSSSRKHSLLLFAKKKLLQITALHFHRHLHDYFSRIITYQKPPSPLFGVIDIYKHHFLYPRFIKWNQNSRKIVYLKKRISEVSIVIHLQITKRKLIKLFNVIGRSAKQIFFYRLILIYMFSNGININNNPMITFINKGCANQYLFSLANALSLNLTKPLANYERHSFLPYIKQLVQLDIKLFNRKSNELNKTTDEEISQEHLNYIKEGKYSQREHSVDNVCLRNSKPEERNTITVKTISLKKKKI